MLAGSLIIITSYLLLAVCYSVVLLYIGAMLQGLAFGLIKALAVSTSISVVPKRHKATASSFLCSSDIVLTGLLAPLVSLVIDRFGVRNEWLMLAVVFTLVLVPAVAFILPKAAEAAAAKVEAESVAPTAAVVMSYAVYLIGCT